MNVLLNWFRFLARFMDDSDEDQNFPKAWVSAGFMGDIVLARKGKRQDDAVA
jgi:hypothetical protein